jgi:hypothetical protein
MNNIRTSGNDGAEGEEEGKDLKDEEDHCCRGVGRVRKGGEPTDKCSASHGGGGN